MNRQEKQTVIESIKSEFQSSQATFVIAMQGMTVEDVQKLRREVYAREGKIKITKNTLLKRATSDLDGVAELAPFFRNQIAVVFAPNEAPAIAKVLFTAAKEQEHLKLVAGTLDARVISVDQIEFLATLPSREVMLARLCGALKAPITNYVSVLNQLLVRPLLVLKEIEKKKESNV